MLAPGFIISVLTGLAFVCALVIEFVRSRRRQPKYWIQTPTTRVGVRWHTESTTWPGLERAVLAIEHVLYLRYGADVVRKKDLMGFWIDVYPKNATLKPSNDPTETLHGRRLTGGIERVSFYLGFTRQFILLIRQMHKTKTKLPNGEIWQDGELLDAGTSALFHEVAEHYVPFMLKGDINGKHADEWKLLTSEMRQAYRMLGEANGKVD